MTGRSQAGLESGQEELGEDAIVVSSDARSLTDIDALASRVKAEFDTFADIGLLSVFTWRFDSDPVELEISLIDPTRSQSNNEPNAA